MKRSHRCIADALLGVACAIFAQTVPAQERAVAGTIQFQGAIVTATQTDADIGLSQRAGTDLRAGKQLLNPPGRSIEVRRMADLQASELANPVLAFYQRNLTEQHIDPRTALYVTVAYQ